MNLCENLIENSIFQRRFCDKRISSNILIKYTSNERNKQKRKQGKRKEEKNPFASTS